MKGGAAGQRARFWAQVAAFGALWGALEITLGSFLHALRLPLAGAVLAGLGAAILVAQRQLLPRRGASLATGAVAALCKSISPGGIILGPMVGILGEALAVELILLAAPRSVWTAPLAGAMAAVTTLIHQVFSLWFYYGGSAIELLRRALDGAGEALGLAPDAGWWAVAALAATIALLGAAGGMLGWWLGRDAQRLLAGRQRARLEVVDGC